MYNSKTKVTQSEIDEAQKLFENIMFRNGFKPGNIELLEDLKEMIDHFDRANKEAENQMPDTEEDCLMLMKAQDLVLFKTTIDKEIHKIRSKW